MIAGNARISPWLPLTGGRHTGDVFHHGIAVDIRRPKVVAGEKAGVTIDRVIAIHSLHDCDRLPICEVHANPCRKKFLHALNVQDPGVGIEGSRNAFTE